MDFKTLTDEQLGEAQQSILEEQERRDNLAQIPTAIQELAAKYTEGGGDRQTLEDALKEAE